MRLNRLEPHVVEPKHEDDDIQSFLDEIRETQKKAKAINKDFQLSEKPADESLKEGFVRLNEFLKQKQSQKDPQNKSHSKFSVQAIAHSRYQAQVDANINASEAPQNDPYFKAA